MNDPQPYTPPAVSERKPLHPNTAELLTYFSYSHLPEPLQKVSKSFAELAVAVAYELQGPEATVCLRKLLEAKDCAVRAALPKPPPPPTAP